MKTAQNRLGLDRLARSAAIFSTTAALLTGLCGTAEATQKKTWHFDMVRSSAADITGCLKKAYGKVTVTKLGQVERMVVKLYDLPKNTEFDLFVLQVPDLPFGLSWYQGDIETDGNGYGKGVFQGRFNEETFIVAPGVAPAPVVHDHPTPTADAKTNPATAPIHTLHLGLWFNDPKDAAKAGCIGVTTPFNGDHDAGVQILSTKNFPPTEGPLGKIGS